MITIHNKLIPFKGFQALTMWPFLFIRGKRNLSKKVLNHENIHAAQQKELCIVFFYLVYFVSWIIGLCKGKSSKEAYRDICFEREAKDHETDYLYLENRPFWNWVTYTK